MMQPLVLRYTSMSSNCFCGVEFLRTSTLQGRLNSNKGTLLGEIDALGEREGVRMRSKAFVGPAKESAILRQATHGDDQLIVLGTKAWSGDRLHFGQSAEALI